MKIKGNFKRYIFKSDTGYSVGLLKIKEIDNPKLEDYINETITFTGYFYDLNPDDTYILDGNFIEHEKYGIQFQTESFEKVLPEDKDAIVDFLCSGLFKGIGEKTATKVVNKLGKDTLNIILDNPSNLLLIPISQKTIDNLHNTLVMYQGSYKTILNLTEMGFNTKESLAIYNKFKVKTQEIIDNNIYLIMENVDNLSFKKIDEVALKNGILKDDTRRIQASILYAIDEVCNLVGHSYLNYDELFQYTLRVLNNNIAISEFDNALRNLILDHKIFKEDNKYYLMKMYEAEENIIRRVGYLVRKSDNIDKKLEKYIIDVEHDNGCIYNDKQREAIRLSFTKNILLVTGGPGTGKTTIIKAICDLYKNINKLSYKNMVEKVALLAPTGRASKRMSEATTLPASTIHRFLKWNKENNKFGVNEYNKSNVELVIIDEFSMVDTYLFDSLLNGLRYDTKLIIVGDYNQLPSVGPGQVLKDLIESEVVPTIKLNELYRQSEGSDIISLAYDINSGTLNKDIFNNKDVIFYEANSNKVKDMILEISNEYIKNKKSIQVLAPMYKTYNGIDILNNLLKDLYNPSNKHKNEIIINNVVYRENDKVIQLTNMPDDNVFNGDIGEIVEIENGKTKEILIDFDDNYVRYTSSDFQKFKHAYAISIHKSQGSEFSDIIIPVTLEYGRMLYRKLIYTGVTRCKKKLYLVGSIEALYRAILNNEDNIRKTSLKEKLIKNILE